MKYNKNIFQILILIVTGISMVIAILTMINDFKVLSTLDSNILLGIIALMVVSVTVVYSIMVFQRINPKKYIFISFSNEDKKQAEIIISILNKCFKSLSKYRFELLTVDSIPYGSKLSETTQEYLVKADTIIVIISHKYVNSDLCAKEFDDINHLNKKIIPIVIDSFDNLNILSENMKDIKALSLINCNSSEAEERLTTLAKDLIKQRKD